MNKYFSEEDRRLICTWKSAHQGNFNQYKNKIPSHTSENGNTLKKKTWTKTAKQTKSTTPSSTPTKKRIMCWKKWGKKELSSTGRNAIWFNSYGKPYGDFSES